MSWTAWSLRCSNSYAGRGKTVDHGEPYRLTVSGGQTTTRAGGDGAARSSHDDGGGALWWFSGL
jgi:hypothetical protein